MAKDGQKRKEYSCSFCGKPQKTVQPLLAGPRVYICEECVASSNEIVEEARKNPPETVTEEDSEDIPRYLDGTPIDLDTYVCSFCGESYKETNELIAGPSVFICDECVGLCQGILDENS